MLVDFQLSFPYTDASLDGFGCIFGTDWFVRSFIHDRRIHAQPSHLAVPNALCIGAHILEMWAVMSAVSCWAPIYDR